MTQLGPDKALAAEHEDSEIYGIGDEEEDSGEGEEDAGDEEEDSEEGEEESGDEEED